MSSWEISPLLLQNRVFASDKNERRGGEEQEEYTKTENVEPDMNSPLLLMAGNAGNDST